MRTSDSTRSGYVAAAMTAICAGCPWVTSVARDDPTASITARRSSTHDSTGMTPLPLESDMPMPRMSNQTTRANDASERMNSSTSGSSETASRWLAQSKTTTMSCGPSPTTW